MPSIHGWKNDSNKSVHVGGKRFHCLNQEDLAKTGFDYFTLFNVFNNEPSRPRGEYQLGSTTCTLDDDPGSENWGYKLEMNFTDVFEAKKLYRLIRAGKIWPKICYEDPQAPAPCRHLKDIWREAIGIIRREVAKKLYFA